AAPALERVRLKRALVHLYISVCSAGLPASAPIRSKCDACVSSHARSFAGSSKLTEASAAFFTAPVFFGFGAANHWIHSSTHFIPPRADGGDGRTLRTTISRMLRKDVSGWTISSGERAAPGRRGSIFGNTS